MTEKNYHIGLLLLVGMIFAILAVQAWLLPGALRSEFDAHQIGYAKVLRSDFWMYVWTDTIKPPVTYIIHGALIWLFGPENFVSGASPFWTVTLLNAVGLLLLYQSAIALRVAPVVAAISIAGLGLALAQLAFWRLGAHYDHLSFPFSALFLWAMVRFALHPTLVRALALGAAGAIVVLQNTVFAVVVPVILIAFWLGWCDPSKRKLWQAWGLAFLLPITAAAGLSAKTWAVSGVFSPSALGGMALMLVSFRTVDRDPVPIRQAAVEAGLPDWWIWCYDNSIPIGAPGANSVDASVYRVTSLSAGFCASFTNHSSETWPLDLIELQKHMSIFDNPEVNAAIEADIDLSRNKRPFQYGFAPELKLKWFELYTRYGAKLHAYHRSENPGLYLKTYVDLANTYAIEAGPRFPARLWRSLGKRQDSLVAQTLRKLTNNVTIIVMIVSPVLLAFSMWRLFLILPRSIFKGPPVRALHIPVPFAIETALSAALLSQLLLFSTLVGEENARYYIYALPFAFLLALSLVGRRWQFPRPL